MVLITWQHTNDSADLRLVKKVSSLAYLFTSQYSPHYLIINCICIPYIVINNNITTIVTATKMLINMNFPFIILIISLHHNFYQYLLHRHLNKYLSNKYDKYCASRKGIASYKKRNF